MPYYQTMIHEVTNVTTNSPRNKMEIANKIM
jgi:hypothetical protein